MEASITTEWIELSTFPLNRLYFHSIALNSLNTLFPLKIFVDLTIKEQLGEFGESLFTFESLLINSDDQKLDI